MTEPLKRVLGAGDAAWLVAGNMIGAGIFITPGFVALRLPGLVAPLVAWAAGGLLALAGAAVYAELGSRLPRAGGDYPYLVAAFGPLWGFMTGWAGWTLTFSAAAAAMSKVFLSYLLAGLPFLAAFEPWLSWLLPAAVLVGLTAANVAGARVAGRATIVFTALPLALLLLLFGWGLATGAVDTAGGSETVAPAGPGDAPAAPGTPWGWLAAFGAALVPVFFTYSGWNAAAYLAGEVRDPRRDLPRGLLAGTLAVTALYLVINAVLLVVLGRGLAGNGTPVADAARALIGPGADTVLSLIIALAILGSANVTLMAGARVYYAMAGDGLAPRPLERVNRRGVPAGALWAGGLWAALLSVVAGVGDLVEWATMAILLLSSLTVVALFVLRRRDPQAAVFRCPGYPWTPALYLVASLGAAASSAAWHGWRSLWGLLLIGLGFVVYPLARRGFRR